MRIRVTGPRISGAPLPGEIGEVDDDLGRMMIAKGYAEDVTKLRTRLGESTFRAGGVLSGPRAEWQGEPVVGIEALLGVPATLTDEDGKEVTVTVEVEPKPKLKPKRTGGGLTDNDSPSSLPG